MGRWRELLLVGSTTMDTEKINFSFVQVSYNPRPEWQQASLNSAKGLFDEYIIVDDGSDPPLKDATVRQENLGCASARNTGNALCTGEWVTSLDDDDEFIPAHVIALKEIALKTDADILHFPCEFFGNISGLWGLNPNLAGLYHSNQIPSNSWYRKSVWDKLGGFKNVRGEDWDFWARAWKHKLKFQFFPHPVYKHRVRPDSLSGQWYGSVLQDIKREVQKSYDEEKV